MYNLAILALIDFENWNNPKSLGMGGVTGVVKSILPFLQADNIYLLGITSIKNNLYKEIRLYNNVIIVPIVYVPKETKIPIRLHAFYYSRKINPILKKYNINSIYTHAEEISFWVKPGFTLIYHIHGSTNALLNAKNIYFRNRLFQSIWEFIRNKNIQKATKIIAIDPLCYNLTQKQNAEEKTLLLPNFVDTNIYYQDDSSSKLLEHINEKILLFVGRLEEVKGLELFVDTLIEIYNRESGNWKGVFVGRGTYEHVIKKYIKDKSSMDLFSFVGPVFEVDELRRIYNKASILMISSYYEGIPMVILESLACRTPVISTNVGGVKDIISDNKMCFVNDNRNPHEFVNIIQDVVSKEITSNEEFKYSASKASFLINNILLGKSNRTSLW